MATDQLQNTTTPKNLTAELTFVPVFNLALQQNALPVVYELKLKNNTGMDLHNIQCQFSSQPGFIVNKTLTVETLKNGEELPLHDLNIELDDKILLSISESMQGKLRVTITSQNETHANLEYPVEAFAADQWLGAHILPELLCAFVTPNLEVISHLQSGVADELQKTTGSSAIEGYQGDKTRVYEICSAIYRAIHSWGIRYANPASSFGTPGQRIRFADTIYQHRLATCLDTTLLFASLMEQCGLHPVILLQDGHAYIGCHLVKRYFADIPMDDLQTIRKLADLDEFLVIETTMVTKDATFSMAETTARTQHLNLDQEFNCAIDVIRARYSGIRPLPLKRSAGGIEIATTTGHVEPLSAEHKRRLQQDIDLTKLEAGEARTGRVVRWTQKLLDLSLRNRLLNVRDTKQVIPIACADITALEDKIATDESLSLNPLSNLLCEKDLHDLALLRISEEKTKIKTLLENELNQQRLWTLLSPAEMAHRLTGLYRLSKTDLEESGVNTLFLAIGFLEWKQSEREQKSFLAPLLLIPIRLQRKSIVEGIRISRINEDTIINETLLELLKNQFQMTLAGLNPLPTDHAGVDVGMVMQIFRQTIKEMKGWEVREEAKIGHFSFGKFVMWNDMTSRIDLLKKHPLVNHLIDGGGLFDDGIAVFPPSELNHRLDFKNLYCPLSADSSQLTAVLFAQLGKNFVLHGPPGTGKSQTITNIIAHNLALGRRVLFVSEKKAALEVVHKRLASIGLRPFCLELHSNKSGKTEVLEQFSEALKVPETDTPAEWESTAEALRKVRDELNEYVTALHHIYPNGLSAYDCFAKQLKQGATFPENLLQIDCLTQTRESFEAIQLLVADLAHAWKNMDRKTADALNWIEVDGWSPIIEKEILAAAKTLHTSSATLAKHFQKLTTWLNLPLASSINNVYNTALLAETLKHTGPIPATFLAEDFTEHMDFLATFSGTAGRRAELQKKLQNYHLDLMAGLNFDGIAARIQSNNQKAFPIRLFKNMILRKELAKIKKIGGEKLTLTELALLIPDAKDFLTADQTYQKNANKASALLGKLWNDGNPDWPALNHIFSQTGKLLEQIRNVVNHHAAKLTPCLTTLQNILPDAIIQLAQNSEARNNINAFLLAWNDFQEKLSAFAAYAPKTLAITDLEILTQEIQNILDHTGDLRTALLYRQIRQNANKSGIGRTADALETGTLPPQQLTQIFEQAYGTNMLDQILARSPVLCNFTGLSQEERIRKFCELDTKYTELSKDIIYARLAAALPRRRSGPCPEGTELGLLKRECEKKTRQKPVRQLLEQIPTLAAVLKPCFLMSPLSVAQYLPPDSASFDVIIFDEASQIPVCDAIGAIARGKQVIVVGDPKQMPPTNFFQKGTSEDSDTPPDDTEDMESILDECLAAGVYSTYLNWHYRSRHESLISFSNHYYYEDKLFTFPAARNSDRLGVTFRFVANGIYDRRMTRTNLHEAQTLVDYVFQRLANPQQKKSSIGIVTFSQAQKDLIEDLIEEKRTKYPQLEPYFNDQGDEPLFIKNLENVQGDERDVILFSVCYAPDADNKISMNFGPLNRTGGERRLNVAITRAKEQIIVFASIHAAQIELSRTQATGATHLKYFLDYAEKGYAMQARSADKTKQDGLATTIADFLVAKGFSVEANVGCSGHRIDLAVRDPKKPIEFLLGIECDGSAYAAQKTTRDRDHLRNSVLHALGWHTYRAWSLDWAFDRQQTEKRLLEKIAEIQRQPETTPLTPPQDNEPTNEPKPEPAAKTPTPPAPLIPEQRKNYAVWDQACDLPQEFFYSTDTQLLIRKQMNEIIQTEAPIYERLLKKRIVKAWGFTRMGDNIQSVLNTCLPKQMEITQLGEERVFWSTQQTASIYADYRIPADEAGKRGIDEIPPEELANAMYEVLVDFNTCEQDTLFRETVRLFGLSAVTAKARKYLEFAIQALKQSGRIN